jgi:BASS family bile acid:Na+ symporter
MTKVLNILLNRNFILILAVVLGFTIGDLASFLQPYTLYILMITMLFSMTGIQASAMLPLKKVVKPMIKGVVLNYILFGTVVILLAWLIMPTKELFYGFIVIAIAPPGVAIIPFSGIMKGDVDYSIIGVVGAFLASVILTPVVVGLFSGGSNVVSTVDLLILMVKLIIIPLILSRFLLWKPLFKGVKIIRGKVVDFGFALIIFTAVGLNHEILFNNLHLLFLITLVLLIATFGIGSFYEYFMKKTDKKAPAIKTEILLLTIKSSGFSVVTAFTVFGKEAALPSAVLAVIVLLYLLFLTNRVDLKKRLIN